MTIDIKKTWLLINWNKPKRIKRHIKRYNKKYRAVYSIIGESKRYGLTLPREFEKSVEKKFEFYGKQNHKLRNLFNAIEYEVINDQNYKTVIDSIFDGTYRWTWKKPVIVEDKVPA